MIKPLNKRVLIKPLKRETILEMDNNEIPQQGEIVEVSNDSEMRIGERIVYSRFTAEKVTYKEEDYYILKDEHILAIIGD